VDHSRQAIIAQKIVLPLLFNQKLLSLKYQKKNHFFTITCLCRLQII
jgi:hypothetical protein